MSLPANQSDGNKALTRSVYIKKRFQWGRIKVYLCKDGIWYQRSNKKNGIWAVQPEFWRPLEGNIYPKTIGALNKAEEKGFATLASNEGYSKYYRITKEEAAMILFEIG